MAREQRPQFSRAGPPYPSLLLWVHAASQPVRNEELQRADCSSTTFPAPSGWAACSPAPFLGGKARAARVGARHDKRGQRGRVGREKHTGCSLLSPPGGQVLSMYLPRILYWALTQPAALGVWASALREGGGGGTCLFQTKPGKPLTSPTGTITQGPSSLKLRRADPSQGKCGHVLSLPPRLPVLLVGLAPPRGAFGWKLVWPAGLSQGSMPAGASAPLHCHISVTRRGGPRMPWRGTLAKVNTRAPVLSWEGGRQPPACLGNHRGRSQVEACVEALLLLFFK